MRSTKLPIASLVSKSQLLPLLATEVAGKIANSSSTDIFHKHLERGVLVLKNVFQWLEAMGLCAGDAFLVPRRFEANCP